MNCCMGTDMYSAMIGPFLDSEIKKENEPPQVPIHLRR